MLFWEMNFRQRCLQAKVKNWNEPKTGKVKESKSKYMTRNETNLDI